jgi:hypothetical protein
VTKGAGMIRCFLVGEVLGPAGGCCYLWDVILQKALYLQYTAYSGMKSLFKFLPIPFFLIACGYSNKTKQSNAIKDSVLISPITDTLKSNFNGDTLKSVFSNTPFNYEFKEEVTIQGTTNSHFDGTETDGIYNKNVDTPNTIIINYDQKSRKATNVVFYLNHFNTSYIQLKHLKKLFEFINYYDPEASKFITKNFKKLFYDEEEYDKLTPYVNYEKKIKMDIDHSLFDARKIEKTSTSNISNEEYIDVTITFL